MRESLDSNTMRSKKGIQILLKLANDCELSINKNKSNIIIFKSNNQTEYIVDIHVTTNAVK